MLFLTPYLARCRYSFTILLQRKGGWPQGECLHYSFLSRLKSVDRHQQEQEHDAKCQLNVSLSPQLPPDYGSIVNTKTRRGLASLTISGTQVAAISHISPPKKQPETDKALPRLAAARKKKIHRTADHQESKGNLPRTWPVLSSAVGCNG